MLPSRSFVLRHFPCSFPTSSNRSLTLVTLTSLGLRGEGERDFASSTFFQSQEAVQKLIRHSRDRHYLFSYPFSTCTTYSTTSSIVIERISNALLERPSRPAESGNRRHLIRSRRPSSRLVFEDAPTSRSRRRRRTKESRLRSDVLQVAQRPMALPFWPEDDTVGLAMSPNQVSNTLSPSFLSHPTLMGER
jgi:hypothetical protein